MTLQKSKAPGTGNLDVNMTPMIDCTFQLIIFFLLTAQMAGEEVAKVLVPHPQESVARSETDEKILPERVIVNIPNRYGDDDKNRDPRLSSQAVCYQIGGTRIPLDATEQLVELLQERKARAEARGIEEFFVEIRGDKDVAFADVEPVLQAAAQAKIRKMSITAIVQSKPQTE